MPDHVTLRIPKPRITLYGLLVTAIVTWGAYSIFWQKPSGVLHPAVLPSLKIPAPTPAALQRSAACVSTTTDGGVSKTLSDAANKSVGQVTREMNAVNACAGASGPAPAH